MSDMGWKHGYKDQALHRVSSRNDPSSLGNSSKPG